MIILKRYFFIASLTFCLIYYVLQQFDAVSNDGGVRQFTDYLEINEGSATPELAENSIFNLKPHKNERDSYCNKNNIEKITAQFFLTIKTNEIVPEKNNYHLPKSEYALKNISAFAENEALNNIEKIKLNTEKKDLIGLLIETNLPEEQVVYDVAVSHNDYSFYDLYSSVKYKEYFRIYSHIIDGSTIASNMTAEEVNLILSLSIKVRNINSMKDIISRFKFNKQVDFYRFIQPPTSTAEMLDNKIIFELLSSNGFILDPKETINLINYVGFDVLHSSVSSNKDIMQKQTKNFISLVDNLIVECGLKNKDFLEYLSNHSNGNNGVDKYRNKEQSITGVNNVILTNKILNLISSKQWRGALNMLADRRNDEYRDIIYSAAVDAAILNDAPIYFFEDIIAGGYIMNTDNVKIAAMRKNITLLDFIINNVDTTNLSVADRQQLLIFLDKSDIPDSVLQEVCTNSSFVNNIEKYPVCVKRTIHQ